MKKIFLLLTIITTTLYAQDRTKQAEIKVSAQGKAKVIPDIVTISFGIETKGGELSKVKKENDLMYEKVLKQMKVNKIDQKDIKTKWFSMYPRYENKDEGTYYVANQNLEVIVRDLSQYEIIMNELVKAGVNRLDYVTFDSSQIEKMRSEARKSAVKEAENKAKDLAEAVGRKVGKIILISDEMQDIYYGYDYQHVGFTQEAPISDGDMIGKQLNVGEMEVKATVSITFLLE